MINKYIGTAKDNMKSPVHNWYKFTAGFSYQFVKYLIEDMPAKPHCIYEPFAGCGTTLVEAQKHGIQAVGNESQQLMCDIINAKLNWNIQEELCNKYIIDIKSFKEDVKNKENVINDYHPLLKTLYDENTLQEIYLIRNAIRQIDVDEYKLFFNLVLSQVLHKSALHPISVPYISRRKTILNPGHAWERFVEISKSMLVDLHELSNIPRVAKVYKADSRKENKNILSGSCDMCITSPPYLNNLDYGEVSKVHSHFFEMTKDWHDITDKIRQNLVTGATTHYRDADFDLDAFRKSSFVENNPLLFKDLEEKYLILQEIAKKRPGRKSFHILMMHYFEDMYNVFIEMRRVLKDGSKAYLILGDSAPYGVYVSTTRYLGLIAQSVGFHEFHIYKIRERGTKWNIKTRHDIELAENILELL